MNRLRFNSEIIQVGSRNTNHKIDNILMSCDYNKNLHMVSYVYLKKLDTIFIYVMMFLAFVSGVIEIINFNTEISNHIYLAIGINNLLLTAIFNRYKELKLSSKANGHYYYFKRFERLMLNINNNVNIQDSDSFLYKDIDAYINHVNYEIEIIFIKRPKFPSKILNKHQINKPDISLSTNNRIILKKRKSDIFDINKSINFIEMDQVNEDDKQNYKEFLDNIEKMNIEEIRKKNESLIHFKTNIIL